MSRIVEYGTLSTVGGLHRLDLRTHIEDPVAYPVLRTQSRARSRIRPWRATATGVSYCEREMAPAERVEEELQIDSSVRIRSAPGVDLSPDQAHLLARVVGENGSAFIKQEFRSGYSGAVVLLVSMGAGQAPVVVKYANPVDLQSEFDAYQRYVVRVSPQNIAHLRGEPLVSADGQLGLLQYTFAGGESHLPTTSLQSYYNEYGGEASAAVLNRVFRVYGRHWWGNNRTEVYTVGEQYDRLLPVHLQVTESDGAMEQPLVVVAGQTSVTALRNLRAGNALRLDGFEVTKVRDSGRTVTLTAPPPAGEASAPLRIRLKRGEAIACIPGDLLDRVDATVAATRQDLLVEGARVAFSDFGGDSDAFAVPLPDESEAKPALILPNPIRELPSLLDRVVETKTSVIHGDLNLQNILVDPQTGFSWLIDFGETRRGPTLLDLQRIEVQVVTKMLPASITEAELDVTALAVIMASLHADPLPVASPYAGLSDPFAVLLTLRRLARHYLVDDLDWDEYYYGLMTALVGALKFDELDGQARGLALVGAATARRLVGEPLIGSAPSSPAAIRAESAPISRPTSAVDSTSGEAPQGWAATILGVQLGTDSGRLAQSDLPLPACPYPGMAPFSEENRASFHGRDREIRDALNRVRLNPFLAVIGSSGSGKSSLVYAGVVPAVRESSHFGRELLEVKSMRPGKEPLSALASLVGVSWAEGGEADSPGHYTFDDSKPSESAAFPRGGGDGANADESAPSATVNAFAAQARQYPILLVVDQAEELFQITEQAQAERFMREVRRLSTVDGVYVILTLRADFFADLMESPLWEEVRDHRLEVTALKGDSLREAIIMPAQQVGVDVDPALVERLIADAADEPGALPFVQETLVLLWEQVENRRLTLSAYTDLAEDDGRSGLQLAMAYRADHAYRLLNPVEQALARRVFLRLVQFGEGRPDTRRQVSVDGLRAAGDDPAAVDEVLSHLADHRLLILSSGSESSPQVDIAHEQLLKGWPLLREWVSQRRDSEQIRRRLEDKALEWVRMGRGEGGRLDEFALTEADRWLASADAVDLGYSAELVKLVEESRAALDAQRAAEEEQRRRIQAALMEADQERKQAETQKRVARQLRRRASVLLVALAVALVAVAAAIWLFRDARIARMAADAARRSEQTLRLASESTIQREVSPQLGFLMALEAANWLDPGTRRPLPEAIHALRAQFDQWSHWQETLLGHEDRVLSVAYGTDGAQIFSSSVDGEVRAWELAAEADRSQTVADLGQAVDALAVHPTRSLLAVGSQDGSVRLVDPSAGYAEVEQWQAHPENQRVLDLAFSADGTTLASGGGDGTVRLWTVAPNVSPSGVLEISDRDECWPPEQCWVRAVDISPDGQLVAAGAQNRRLYVWDLSEGETPSLLIDQRLAGNVRDVAFNRDGTWLAAGDEAGWIHLYSLPAESAENPEAVRPAHQFKLPQLPDVRALAFSPVADILAIAGQAGLVMTLRVAAQIGEPHTLGIIDSGLESVAFSPDGESVATGGSDGSIRTWHTEPVNREPVNLAGHTGTIRAISFLPVLERSPLDSGGPELISVGEDQSVRLWTPSDSLSESWTASEDGNEILAAAISPDGRWLATGGRDGNLRLREWSDLDSSFQIIGRHAGEITSVAFSPDSQTLASGASDRRIFLWDLSSFAAEPQALDNPEAGVLSVEFSSDGASLASGDEAGRVKLWDLTQPAPLGRVLFRHDNWVRSLSFSPDNGYLASASDDGTIRLSALAEFVDDQGPVTAHEPRVRAIAFDPTGAVLASAGDDGTIRLWNPVDLAQEPVALREHVGSVRALAFDQTGVSLASGGEDAVVRIWTVPLDELRRMACDRVARNFTESEWLQYVGSDKPRRTCPNVAD